MPASEPMTGVVSENPNAKPAWALAADGGSARFGLPGAQPMLSVACRSGVLVVTRHVPAEIGATALFALIGERRIVRLPVDATSVPGSRGYVWQGTLPAADPAAEVFTTGGFSGTLPGAGRIAVTGGAPVRDVVARCSARPVSTQPATGPAPAPTTAPPA